MKRLCFYILDVVIYFAEAMERLAYGYRASMEMLHLWTRATGPRDVFSSPLLTS